MKALHINGNDLTLDAVREVAVERSSVQVVRPRPQVRLQSEPFLPYRLKQQRILPASIECVDRR